MKRSGSPEGKREKERPASPGATPGIWRHPLGGPARIVLALLLVLLGLGWLPGLEIFDAISVLRLHLVALVLLSAVICALLGAWPMAVAGGLGALATLAMTPEVLGPGGDAHGDASSVGACPSLHVLTINFFQWNQSLDQAVAMVLATDVDLVAVQEPPRQLRQPDGPLSVRFPYRLALLSPGPAAGPMIFSSRPFEVRDESKVPKFLAVTLAPGDPCAVTLATVHMNWPVIGDQWWEAEVLVDRLSPVERPLVLLGDLNAAPWSSTVRRLKQGLGLRSLHGAMGTYRGGIGGRGGKLKVPGGLPIDQILGSPDVSANEVELLDIAGSDHRAVRTKLTIQPRLPAEAP